MNEDYEIGWWIFCTILGSVGAGVATIYWILL